MNQGRPGTVDVLGCRVSKVNLEGSLQALQALLESGTKHQVSCLTVYSILCARKDERLRSLFNRASLALPDGLPVVWASKLLGEPVPGRAAGPDLLLLAAQAAVRWGCTFYLMGGGRGVAARLAERLTRVSPGLRVVGACSPPFHAQFPPTLNQRIIAGINAAKPDILWVGLGTPKQDFWIAANLERLAVRVAIGVGAAFDMYGGEAGRAPLWLQRSGLEWLFRFLRNPRRLFRRYFVESPLFIPLVILQRLGGIFRRRE